MGSERMTEHRKIDTSTAPPAEWSPPPAAGAPVAPAAALAVAGIIQTAEIDKLAAAMARFQSAVTGASKGGAAKIGAQGAQTRHYTRMEDVWDAARKPLTANGLSVMQWPTTPDDGRVTVVTRVLHESGQWMQASLSMAVDKSGHMNVTQQYGSAITYCCRYAFLAALGLPPSDDDAESAGDRERPQSTQPRKRSSKSDRQPAEPASTTPSPVPLGTTQTWQTKIRGATDEATLKRVWTAFLTVRDQFSSQQIAPLVSLKDRRKAALADTTRCTHDETERDPDGNSVCLACDLIVTAAGPGQRALGDDDVPEGFGP